MCGADHYLAAAQRPQYRLAAGLGREGHCRVSCPKGRDRGVRFTLAGQPVATGIDSDRVASHHPG